MSEVTQILKALQQGDTTTTDELLPLVYEELRRIAASKLKREVPGHTLQTTALVHEAYMKLIGGTSTPTCKQTDASEISGASGAEPSRVSWDSKGHFFAAAAESMRRILIDNARRKKQLKRGGDLERVEFDNIQLADAERSIDLIALDEALTRLEEKDEVKARIVKLRYFAGLTIEQSAKALGVSEPTVKRHWAYSRAWLKREMEDVGDSSP